MRRVKTKKKIKSKRRLILFTLDGFHAKKYPCSFFPIRFPSELAVVALHVSFICIVITIGIVYIFYTWKKRPPKREDGGSKIPNLLTHSNAFINHLHFANATTTQSTNKQLKDQHCIGFKLTQLPI